jgi:multidrug efflux pump
VRKKVGDMRNTLPQGVIGPFFNDEFGDVYGSIFALSADGFSEEELRVFAERCASQLLRVPDVAKVELFGAQAEKIFVEISQKRLAQLGLDMNQVLAQLARRTRWKAPACWTPARRTCRCGWPGSSTRWRNCAPADPRHQQPGTGQWPAQLRLGDIADIRRGYHRPAGREGAPPGQGGDRAGRVHGQGRRHHRLGKAAAGGPRRLRPTCRPASARAGAGPAGRGDRVRWASSSRC